MITSKLLLVNVGLQELCQLLTKACRYYAAFVGL
jgi:hypothetical protein